MPGRKDNKSVKVDGKRVQVQKRQLILYMREAYQMYKTVNPESTVSLSSFNKLKPDYIINLTLKDQQVCLCRYHEDAEMLLEGMCKLIVNLPIKSESLLEQTMCSLDSTQCSERMCADSN